ncbi:MAG: FecR family protein, partial [Opitutaceae bacterium]
MNSFSSESSAAGEAGIRGIAARWVVRQDRRLSAAEAAELEAWLGADPRHAAAFEQSQASWRRYREIGDAARRTPVGASESRSRWHWAAVGSLAAAAAFALIVFAVNRESHRTAAGGEARSAAMKLPPAPVTRQLADGSVARLKDGAEIAESFSAAERRVRLVRGEAFFTVTKDAARPFLVEAGNVTVRAVGTAFAVRFAPKTVDVWVTEGAVQVTPRATETASPERPEAPGASALVGAGHRAVVARTPESEAPSVVVTAVSPEEIARTLAW